MRCTPTLVTALLLSLAATALFGRAPERDGSAATSEQWEITKLAVARESVASDLRFFRSLQAWARGSDGKPTVDVADLITVDGDFATEVPVPGDPVIHIRGNLATTLRVTGHAEVVIGGGILKNGRIESDGVTTVHVQADVDGAIVCGGMAAIWVGGDLHGEVLTGLPSMRLHVNGDLHGVVRPISSPALLYIDARGEAPSAVLAATDRFGYTELQIAAGTSDIAPGIHRLWNGTNGFVAVGRSSTAR